MGHKICHMFADSFFSKQKIYWSFFVVVINVWPLNYFKLQPMQPLQAVVSSSTSSHQPNILWLHRTTLQPLPSTRFSPHSNDNQIKVPCYFQMVFYLLCQKIFGLLNIASWLALNKPLWTRNCNRCS